MKNKTIIWIVAAVAVVIMIQKIRQESALKKMVKGQAVTLGNQYFPFGGVYHI